MKSLISILIFSTMVILLMYGAIAEVDYRRDLVKNRGKYMQWWQERDLNQHVTAKGQTTK